MARPSKVEISLNKKYMGKSMSETIRNTPVDYDRLRNSPLSQAQVDEIKKKYSIKTYSSKEEYMFLNADDARRAIVQE